jgi:hypothetical protein
MIHPELRGGSPHRASAGDGKKVANVIPVDHGAIPHRAVRLPNLVSSTSNRSFGVYLGLFDELGPIPNDWHRSSQPTSVVQPDRLRTTDVRVFALNA